MDTLLTFSDLQHIIAAKAFFFVFLAFAILAIYRRAKFSTFLVIVGATSALSYFALVKGTGLLFWGLQGDEVTIAAMYEKFAHGSLISDFAYSSLPPFYPPLWFQIFGLLGRIVNWNGIQIAKFASFATILFFPFIVYGIQRWYHLRFVSADKFAPGKLAWFLSGIFVFLAVDWNGVIVKPYELVSAFLIVLWTVFLVMCVQREQMNGRSVLGFGASGGVLFILFYFWFFLSAIGVAMFNLFSSERIARTVYSCYAIVGGLTLLFASPFWLPLALSYRHFGAENWQLGFFVIDWIQTLPAWSLGIATGIFLFGLTSLIIYRRVVYMRVLLSLLVASYIWQMMGMVTISLFGSPLQESKGFYFWNGAIVALAAAYGVERLWRFVSSRFFHSIEQQRVISILAVLVLATLFPFGRFMDDKDVYLVRARAFAPRAGIVDLAKFLNRDPMTYDIVTLSSGIPELNAFTPINTFVYFNQHNSHPAATFSARVEYVRYLASLVDPKQFYQAIKTTPFGPIDRLILYKGEKAAYPVYIHIDNFPYGFKEEEIRIPRSNITAEFFDTIFDNGHFIVFAPRAR